MGTPTPEDRPKSWKRHLPEMGRQLLVTFLGSLFAIGLAIGVTPVLPLFDEALSRWQYVVPTCGDPRGLELLDIAAMQAKGDAKVEVSSESGEKSQRAINAFDGRPGSGWVPETVSPRDDAAAAASAEASKDRMVLTFTSPQRIALMCVVNGNASDWNSYIRADRARTVEVRLGEGEQEVTRSTSLRTLPQNELQNRQDLKVPDPKTLWASNAYKQVSLTLLNRYLGSQVDDPNTGEVVDEASRLVMLAEVEVWIDKKQ
ncbi:hypothetical protein [Arthrobacter sp. B1I2]|uniref:hypothetical protein n=1 Tax=Arthrobacter sp. B1I2 TaxID=3042263 RepID=UPI0027878068|nr:hypothetical protein [Arthrobacter sp. B1I2]MDQ0733269.1 hypothetical protein [Arthrobacter sp. B1I2]